MNKVNGHEERCNCQECLQYELAEAERYIQILEELCSSEVLKEAQDRLKGEPIDWMKADKEKYGRPVLEIEEEEDRRERTL